jgi:hypothetical protein
MKTRKIMAYVLISLFVFSPFLNFESWALSRTYPLVKAVPTPSSAPAPVIFIPVCFPFGDEICCEIYRCDPDMTSCVLLGDGPFCAPPSSPLK